MDIQLSECDIAVVRILVWALRDLFIYLSIYLSIYLTYKPVHLSPWAHSGWYHVILWMTLD